MRGQPLLLQEAFEAWISTGSKLLQLLHRRRRDPLMLLPGCRGLQVWTAATNLPRAPLPRQLCLLHRCLQQGQSSRRQVFEQGCQTLQSRTGAGCLTIGASVAVAVTVFITLGLLLEQMQSATASCAVSVTLPVLSHADRAACAEPC